jgi:phospholipid/cholesterol/gamma-HCH transport system substrate-binding protein
MSQRSHTAALEFNVGAMTLLALGFFSWLILFVGDVNPFGKDYTLYADFDEVQLLQQGDPVRKNGLIIGKVEQFRFQRNRVRVIFRIQGNFHIRKDARVAVGNVGLFGANYIKVTEFSLKKGQKSPGFYEAGDIIDGDVAPEFETLLTEGTSLLGDLRNTIQSLTSLLDDEDFRENLHEAIREVREGAEAGRRSLDRLETSVEKMSTDAEAAVASARDVIEGKDGFTSAMEKLNHMLEEVDQIASENRTNLRKTTEAVQKIVEDIRDQALATRLSDAAKQMNKFSSELNDFVEKLNKNGETPEQIRRIMDRVENITSDLASMTGTTKKAVSESDLKGNLSRAFDDMHSIAKQADDLGGKLSKMRTSVVASLFYSDNVDDFHPDLNGTLHFNEHNFIRLGVEDIGGNDSLNLQLGQSFGDQGRLRLGIIADEFGIGYDRYLFRKAVQVRLEVFRPNDLLFRYAARLRLRDELFLTYRGEDFGTPASGGPKGHVSYLGVERRF